VLGALERGDFAARLPITALDDLGFLGLSFNRTAETPGDAVERLRCSEARFRSLVQHSLGVHTVAEGVETEAQRAQLLALGCRLG